MKTTKLLILLGFMTVFTGAYACQTYTIQTPNGIVMCYDCGNGYVYCNKL